MIYLSRSLLQTCLGPYLILIISKFNLASGTSILPTSNRAAFSISPWTPQPISFFFLAVMTPGSNGWLLHFKAPEEDEKVKQEVTMSLSAAEKQLDEQRTALEGFPW